MSKISLTGLIGGPNSPTYGFPGSSGAYFGGLLGFDQGLGRSSTGAPFDPTGGRHTTQALNLLGDWNGSMTAPTAPPIHGLPPGAPEGGLASPDPVGNVVYGDGPNGGGALAGSVASAGTGQLPGLTPNDIWQLTGTADGMNPTGAFGSGPDQISVGGLLDNFVGRPNDPYIDPGMSVSRYQDPFADQLANGGPTTATGWLSGLLGIGQPEGFAAPTDQNAFSFQTGVYGNGQAPQQGAPGIDYTPSEMATASPFDSMNTANWTPGDFASFNSYTPGFMGSVGSALTPSVGDLSGLYTVPNANGSSIGSADMSGFGSGGFWIYGPGGFQYVDESGGTRGGK